MNEESSVVPKLPKFIRTPLSLVPGTLHSGALVLVLNRVLARQLNDGELDFLHHRVLRVEVRDAGINYRLSLDADRLVAARRHTADDVVFSGDVYDFLELVARKKDPDSLFFQRRLVISGDTELGLYLKNFLDALDPEELPAIINAVIPRAANCYKRILA